MQSKVSQLNLYPVKSARGIALETMSFDERGPALDRAYMVVDRGNRFVTQRKFPSMCLIEIVLRDDVLHLTAPGKSHLTIDPQSVCHSQTSREVVVWKDSVDALDCGAEAASWFSDYLGFECRLVYMPPDVIRRVDTNFAKQQQTVSFADGFPILIASEASLERFNRDLSEHGSLLNIGMERFRPNIVVSGCAPFAEDSWQQIAVGDLQLSLVKPCSRCIIPAIDQAQGTKNMEVIEVLNKTRRRETKTYFGQNALHDKPGLIKLGDVVTVLK